MLSMLVGSLVDCFYDWMDEKILLDGSCMERELMMDGWMDGWKTD